MVIEGKLFEVVSDAQRHLDAIPGVTILEYLTQTENEGEYYLKISIKLQEFNNDIPEVTHWYVVVSHDYFDRVVKVYPALEKGVTNTWNHQENNGITAFFSNERWRSGKLCLDEWKLGESSCPQSSEWILHWYVRRAVEWLECAVSGTLVCNGEPYEKPEFIPYSMTETPHGEIYITYLEDGVTCLKWEDSATNFGYVNLGQKGTKGNYSYFPYGFFDENNENLHTVEWGDYYTILKSKTEKVAKKAIWFLLETPPVINGFQAPNNYAELEEAFQLQRRSFFEELARLTSSFRDGKRHIAMLGYYAPEKFGDESPSVVIWQPLLLPVLTRQKDKKKTKIKIPPSSLPSRDRSKFFKEEYVSWGTGYNMAQREITSRGKYCQELCRQKVLLIGCGCLGSMLAELLVRGGVSKIDVVDNDRLNAGNLSRHTLDLVDLRKQKATSLSLRLITLNPNVTSTGHVTWINPENVKAVEDYSLVIDCSGSDEVLKAIGAFQSKRLYTLISASLGYNARYIYLLATKSRTPNVGKLFDLLKMNVQAEPSPPTLEGVGCWSPLFPARVDEVSGAASFIAGLIEKIFSKNITLPFCASFEKQDELYSAGYTIKDTIDGK